MPYVEIENPRGFDPKIDMEPDVEPLMKDPIDKQGCTVKVFAIREVDLQQICLTIDTKFETTTLNLSKEEAIALARMLYEKAEKL
jgi:hypothetical protein